MPNITLRPLPFGFVQAGGWPFGTEGDLVVSTNTTLNPNDWAHIRDFRNIHILPGVTLTILVNNYIQSIGCRENFIIDGKLRVVNIGNDINFSDDLPNRLGNPVFTYNISRSPKNGGNGGDGGYTTSFGSGNGAGGAQANGHGGGGGGGGESQTGANGGAGSANGSVGSQTTPAGGHSGGGGGGGNGGLLGLGWGGGVSNDPRFRGANGGLLLAYGANKNGDSVVGAPFQPAAGGGGGGTRGYSGGFLFIQAKRLELNVPNAVDVSGENGGAGGGGGGAAGGGGGGGGAGGNGGLFLFRKTNIINPSNIKDSFGAGGIGGIGGSGSPLQPNMAVLPQNGQNGQNGDAGLTDEFVDY